mgnify:CR=1 FL=1
MDFGIPLKLNDGTVLGSVIGGQVLPEHPNEEKFRGVARELGINEDEYIEALGKVTVRTEAEINAAANLLGAVLNNFINSEYKSCLIILHLMISIVIYALIGNIITSQT